jgi:hypothetical protein
MVGQNLVLDRMLTNITGSCGDHACAYRSGFGRFLFWNFIHIGALLKTPPDEVFLSEVAAEGVVPVIYNI